MKTTFKFLAKWPSYALLPVFTPFTFGGQLVKGVKGQRYLALSYNWTWFNLAFSALATLIGPYIQALITVWLETRDDPIQGFCDDYDCRIPMVSVGLFFSPSLAYFGCIVSFAFLIKVQDGKCIQRTAFHLDSCEEIKLDMDQAPNLTQAELQEDVACLTASKNESKMKQLNLLPCMVELQL